MNDKTVKFQNKLNARYNNEYLELINNDKRKNKYCLDNNIQLIRIKYSYYKELDNILKLIVLEKDSETIRKFLVKNE